MSIVTNIEDLRRIARRRIPRAIYDYVERGSYDEITLNANRAELNAIRLRQRVLIDVSKVSLASSMLGEDVSMPVAIAPTGLTGLVHGDGEMLAARAAEAAGIKFCLSTMSICSIEDVRSVLKKPFWFQLYMFRDRGFSQSVGIIPADLRAELLNSRLDFIFGNQDAETAHEPPAAAVSVLPRRGLMRPIWMCAPVALPRTAWRNAM